MEWKHNGDLPLLTVSLVGVPRTHHARETHRSGRAAWLRAAVLGADDGIVSTAALMIGVAAADGSSGATITAGVAGLVAGALSMAAGEYVSVSSQRDSERADLAKESRELEDYPADELGELTEIYVSRGLDRALAEEVAVQLHDHDALGAHLRDELGLDRDQLARPVQAGAVSAAAFALGASLPLVAALLYAGGLVIALVALVGLGLLGILGAGIGGAPKSRGALRVLAGGGAAMAVTAVVGTLIGPVG